MQNEHEAGRGTEFYSGARSIQQGAGREGFRPESVLEQNHVLKAPNGLSAQDRARQTLSGEIRTLNGQSQNTYESRLWLGSAPRTYGG